MTRLAVASASCSKGSDGSLTATPLPVLVPGTGPLRCCRTWVSS